ncbi:alpha/beta hydrolase [Streptomyces sp. NPDC048290]|uniref:alpha/beta fold hydrolase n=1 Tax=Streptomyces sp. NPDC048290 TaxID=3155811 RepID=UPI00342D4C6D
MPYITIGHEHGAAVDLYYEDHGTGRPAVLIHGYPLDARGWYRQVPALLAAGHRVITYDRRGFGRSSPVADGYDYDTFAADLERVLTALDVTGAVLVGHAMGTGEIARYLGAHGAARVTGAAFLAPLPPFLLRTEATPHGVELSRFDALIARARGDRAGYLAELRAVLLAPDGSGDAALADAFADLASTASARACVAVIPTWITDFRADVADLAATGVPVLIVQGTQDQFLPIDATGRSLRRMLPRARYLEIGGAPHGLLWTHADQVNAALLDFLSGT